MGGQGISDVISELCGDIGKIVDDCGCLTIADESSTSAGVAQLLSRATSALRVQDLSLRHLLSNSRHAEGYTARGAAGLAYWVFEHNVAYTIFCEWATTHPVLWDESLAAEWAPKKKVQADDEEEAINHKGYIDLQVVNEQSGTRQLYELKWINRLKPGSLKNDKSKLIEACNGRGGSSAYQLLLSSGSLDDLKRVGPKLSREGLGAPTFVGVFPTQLVARVSGYFMLTCVRVVG